MVIGHEHLLLYAGMIFASPQRTRKRNLHLVDQHNHCHSRFWLTRRTTSLPRSAPPSTWGHHSSAPYIRKVPAGLC